MEESIRVAVVMGGQSAEREVSFNTGATVVRELAVRFRVQPIAILEDGRWVVPRGFVGQELPNDPTRWFGGPPLGAAEAAGRLLEAEIDVAFNALHGPFGEDGTIQGFFRTLGIAFTGPDVIPAAVTMDKHLTKRVMEAAEIPTPRSFRIRSSELARGPLDWEAILRRESPRIPLPWVMKPNRLGSSVGVVILRDARQVLEGAQAALDGWPESAAGDDLLVEEAVRGRELTCGVIETDGVPRALPPIEIRPRSSAFFDYHAKYTPGASEELCPAPLTAAETLLVQETALRTHAAFDCAPLSRTDLFLTPSGEVRVLEVNTLPGMTQTSLIPLSAGVAGIRLGDLLASIVAHGISRAAKTPVSS